ncbi:GldG family protein [Paenibacillus sp. SYP-B3998]|uniref:GldG family protein n=1 Tax=Paenibacillus sp. SYP-B3998 TaxID=2678564 RepID=A0A6G4A4R4_9BACL|nr:GldG family protein [Paenibacillus sp. SYP-B3998]NEW08799.1 GldG family protein [Paenibacillus sp. SYP-B3998]
MNKWIRGTNATVLSIAVIGIFIILTIFLHSLKGFQLDLTKNKSFTLSEQTVTTLKNLNQDIHIIAFTNSGAGSDFITRQVTDMAAEYKKQSGKITYDEYDMLKQPSMAKQYGVDQSGTLIFELGDKKKNVNFAELFNGQQDGSYTFTGEEKFTQAITSLTSTEKHTVYLLSGHQEYPQNAMTILTSSLISSNYVVKDLNLYREGKIPDDAQMLLLLGPQNDLNDKEAELINTYLKDKGKIYIALGFNKDMATKWKNIDSIMKTFGIQDQHAVAIEPKQTSLYDPLTIIPEYGSHEITNKLASNNLITMLSLAVSLNADESAGEWTKSVLLTTSDKAYGETDINLLAQSKTKQDAADVKGPLNLGYAIQNKDNKPKAVILGGSTFVLDEDIQNQGNKDFALNSIGWLQEQKDQVTIRPRQGDAFQQALITPSQANTIFIITIVFFPLLFLVIGGMIWWRRRRG